MITRKAVLGAVGVVAGVLLGATLAPLPAQGVQPEFYDVAGEGVVMTPNTLATAFAFCDDGDTYVSMMYTAGSGEVDYREPVYLYRQDPWVSATGQEGVKVRAMAPNTIEDVQVLQVFVRCMVGDTL